MNLRYTDSSKEMTEAKHPQELRKEFEVSLNTFLDVCKENGIKPTKDYSGKFNLRVSNPLFSNILKVCDYIEQNLDDDFSLSQLATIGNSSKFHFSRSFKEHLGQTPSEFRRYQKWSDWQQSFQVNNLTYLCR